MQYSRSAGFRHRVPLHHGWPQGTPSQLAQRILEPRVPLHCVWFESAVSQRTLSTELFRFHSKFNSVSTANSILINYQQQFN